jgi:hypothetical protein
MPPLLFIVGSSSVMALTSVFIFFGVFVSAAGGVGVCGGVAYNGVVFATAEVCHPPRYWRFLGCVSSAYFCLYLYVEFAFSWLFFVDTSRSLLRRSRGRRKAGQAVMPHGRGAR